MNVSYHHANPYAGNESFLLRFEHGRGQTACVLVDAGPDVDLDDFLGEDEYLTAIVLTHAHADHYLSLAANLRDGAPIYTSSATARILETVLNEADRHTETINHIDAILDALEPLDGWDSPIEGLRLAPVPAGHTPGAAGFVFEFETDAGTETILATGDWTYQRAAGYHGFDTVLPADIGAVFLTGATNGSYEETLTESIVTICKRAHAGSTVLMSASGLTGVQYAYLLGHFGSHLDRPLSIELAGQTAKLYTDLDYDVPNVETVPEFDDPGELLTPETVTIAGPEVPTEGSSGRLLTEIRDDPNATLVQVVGDGDTIVSSGACTTYDFEVIAHPTEADVDALVEDFDPMQVVVTHQRGRAASRYKDRYNSFVWATDDSDEYTIYEDGKWIAPPWMTTEGVEYVRQGSVSGRGGWLGDDLDTASGDGAVALPSCERVEGGVDLAAEGLNVSSLEDQVGGTKARESESGKSIDGEETPAVVSDSIGEKDSSDGAVLSDSVASITARLDEIESELQGTTVPARTVDAGDGVTLLRILGDVDIEHGRDVEVTVRGLADSDEP